MKELGIQSFVRVRRYRSYKGNYGKVAPNVNDNIRMYKKWNLYMYKNMHL